MPKLWFPRSGGGAAGPPGAAGAVRDADRRDRACGCCVNTAARDSPPAVSASALDADPAPSTGTSAAWTN